MILIVNVCLSNNIACIAINSIFKLKYIRNKSEELNMKNVSLKIKILNISEEC